MISTPMPGRQATVWRMCAFYTRGEADSTSSDIFSTSSRRFSADYCRGDNVITKCSTFAALSVRERVHWVLDTEEESLQPLFF